LHGITWRDKVVNKEVRNGKEQDKYFLRKCSEKGYAMAWSCHENGWSTHSEASAILGSWEIKRPDKPRMNWRDVVMTSKEWD